MSYLDKAKSVLRQTSARPKEVEETKETKNTNKGSHTQQTVLNPLRNNTSTTLLHLPWQLERLVSAASSGVLPETVMLATGLVTDLNRYVLGWAASYLVGDRAEAERRLWEAHRAWQGANG